MQTVHHRRFNALNGFEYFDHTGSPAWARTTIIFDAEEYMAHCVFSSLESTEISVWVQNWYKTFCSGPTIFMPTTQAVFEPLHAIGDAVSHRSFFLKSNDGS